MNLRANLVVSLKIGVLVFLIGVLLAISQSSFIFSDELIRTALAIDFIFTVPVVYFFLIKRTSIPNVTVIPVFLASYALASVLLPNGIGLMSVAGWVLVPAVEVVVFGYLVFRIYRTRKAYQEEAGQGLDLMERLRNAFVRELKPPAIARAAAFEATIFAYVFLKWSRPRSDRNVFSYHRTNSPILVLGVFLFLIAAETIGIHLLLGLWSETLAWVATALSLYLVVQIVAHVKALSLRPIEISDTHLFLRCGILGDAVVRLDIIGSMEAISTAEDAEPGVDLIPLGAMSQPNVRLNLVEPVTVYGVYGFEKTAKIIRLRADDPDALVEAIRNRTKAD